MPDTCGVQTDTGPCVLPAGHLGAYPDQPDRHAGHFYNYSVKITHADLPDQGYWRWQVDGEPGNGVFGFGTARTRRKAVRSARRCIARHARRRGEQDDFWWVDPGQGQETGPSEETGSHD